MCVHSREQSVPRLIAADVVGSSSKHDVCLTEALAPSPKDVPGKQTKVWYVVDLFPNLNLSQGVSE